MGTLVASAVFGYAVATTGSWGLSFGALGVATMVALGVLRPRCF